MRISDWSSDVCSSDLRGYRFARMKMSKAANYMLGVSGAIVVGIWAIASLGEDDANGVPQAAAPVVPESVAAQAVEVKLEVPVAKKIGRAPGRERGSQYVKVTGVAGSLKKKNMK